MLLRDGETCPRVARAGRAALLVDMECYFEAAKVAMSQARRTIHLLNWAFEPQTFLDPGPDCTGDENDRIGNFLKSLAVSKPDVDIRILFWDSSMPVAATQHFFPFADRKAFRGTRVRFVLDSKLPFGACHHQKMIVIDDQIAFCGGGDIGPDRLSITHILIRHDLGAELDVGQTGKAAPDDRVAWWRVIGSREVSAQPGELRQIEH